ncbi:MAG: MoaD/ThiS family protein [Sedimentisphaerales bacterium]|nr:MoaD/ThiS family protein [Sedimentisphaerales bacterium]
MVVEVRLFATLREGRFKKKDIELPAAGSLKSLLERLKIPEKEVGILLVNGRNACSDYTLTTHDIISIFPLIGGG